MLLRGFHLGALCKLAVARQCTLDRGALWVCSKEIDVTRLEECGACDNSGIQKGTQARQCSSCGGSGQVVQTMRTPMGAFQQVRVTVLRLDMPCMRPQDTWRCSPKERGHRHLQRCSVQVQRAGQTALTQEIACTEASGCFSRSGQKGECIRFMWSDPQTRGVLEGWPEEEEQVQS